MGWSGYSDTAATGKRPLAYRESKGKLWYWLPPHHHIHAMPLAKNALPAEMWFRIDETSWATKEEACAAADDAFRRAVADGAMPPPS